MDPDQENRQTTQVRETQSPDGQTVQRETVQQNTSTASTATVVQRVIWYIAGVIIALLALRIVLLLLGANNDAAFVDFIYSLSGIFAWPFFGIFNYEPTYGRSFFEISSVVAIVVYALIAWGLAKLFTLNKGGSEV